MISEASRGPWRDFENRCAPFLAGARLPHCDVHRDRRVRCSLRQCEVEGRHHDRAPREGARAFLSPRHGPPARPPCIRSGWRWLIRTRPERTLRSSRSTSVYAFSFHRLLVMPSPSTRSSSRRSPLMGPPLPTTRRFVPTPRAFPVVWTSLGDVHRRQNKFLTPSRRPPQVNIAMAVALDGGLITPVLQDVANTDIFSLGKSWKVCRPARKHVEPIRAPLIDLDYHT